MTYTLPKRRTVLHLLHNFFTDARTFITVKQGADPPPTNTIWINLSGKLFSLVIGRTESVQP